MPRQTARAGCPREYPVRRRLLLLALALPLTSCAGLSFKEPGLWSVEFYVPAGVCLADLKHTWGNLSVFNLAAVRGRLRRACGQERGNRIGSYTFELPVPVKPLVVSYRTETGVEHSYAVDVYHEFPGRDFSGTRFVFTLSDSSLALSLEKQGTPTVTKNLYPKIDQQ